MITLTISGNSPDELKTAATTVFGLLFGASAKATEVLSASEQSRLRADATVVPPKSTEKAPTAAEKKAAEKAAKEAAKAAAAAEVETANETPSDDDVLEENTGTDETEELTHDDVKKLLIAVREAKPKEATIISDIVKKFGKASKISEVDTANLPAVAAHCKKLLGK